MPWNLLVSLFHYNEVIETIVNCESIQYQTKIILLFSWALFVYVCVCCVKVELKIGRLDGKELLG